MESYNINPGAVAEIQAALILLLQYYYDNVTSTTVASSQSTVSAIRQTLLSGLDAINAYSNQSQLAQELSLLNNLNSLPLGLSDEDQALITNRLTGLTQFVATSYNPNTLLSFNLNMLAQGQSAFFFPDYLLYLFNFTGEPTYFGLTLENFVDTALEEAVAWQNVVDYLQQNPTLVAMDTYDAANRMAACSNDAYNMLTSALTYLAPLPATIPLSTLWNLLVAVPTILRVGSLLVNNPTSLINQMVNSLKYLMYFMIQGLNAVLVSYDAPATAVNPSTTILRQGESLLDVAARTFGDVEQWQTIVQLNGLVPPYVIYPPPNVLNPAEYPHPAGTVIVGDSLYLSSAGTSTSPINSYFNVFLGTDISFGPLFRDEIPFGPDFVTVSGYNNYSGALARRVLTQITSLIYHTDYGTIIPGQLGSISTTNTALLLASSLKSAILADARTQSVSEIQAIALGPYQIGLKTTAIPKGDITGGTSVAFTINTNATAVTT